MNGKYPIQLSKGTIKESSPKMIENPADIIKLMPGIETAIKNAVGIEVHDNRYYYDTDTVNFLEMLGGFVDNDYFVPVRFGVKVSRTGRNNLYVVISQDKIKKDKVIKPRSRKNIEPNDSRLSDISISKVLENVNSEDIIRYVPDGFLSEAQRKIKYEAIAETIKYTNDKNDKKYKEYIEKGKLSEAKRMVDEKVLGFRLLTVAEEDIDISEISASPM